MIATIRPVDRPGSRWWAAAFVADATIHLAAHAWPQRDGIGVIQISQFLLMPLLAAVVLTVTRVPRARAVRPLLGALGFSCLGDTVPAFLPSSVSFLVLVGCFLLAQLTYIALLWPSRRASVLGHRRPVLLAYVAALLALIVLCGPHAGALLVPVVVYGVCLTTMAVLATGLGRLGAVGGALFFVSDALIAVRAFVPDLPVPGHGVLVMATYIAAQALLAHAVVAHDDDRRRGAAEADARA